jgi:hypothetical protein
VIKESNFKQKQGTMKNLIFILMVFMLASCQQKKLDSMQAVRDSLENVSQAKDSTITDFVSSMNEIQANLDSIRELEDIVNIESRSNAEPGTSRHKKILGDIAMINNLLQKNKELVASLNKKLSSSSYKMKEMQVMLDRMGKQIAEKDVAIASLKEELEHLHFDVESLNKDLMTANEKAESQAKLIDEKTGVIDQQTTAINTAYYVFGTAKELVENGIAEKDGGFLGLGRSFKFRKDFNPDLFTKVDIREVDEINLNAKKAKVITTHPAGSFELTGDDQVEKLVINDPETFWETSKYLVILVK